MFHYVMTITDKATKKIKKVANLYLHRSIYDLGVREEMITIYTGQIDLCRYDINFIERQVRQMNPRMKGYYTSTCFMGWIPRFHQYLPFATEKEYIEFFKEMESNHENPSN